MRIGGPKMRNSCGCHKYLPTMRATRLSPATRRRYLLHFYHSGEFSSALSYLSNHSKLLSISSLADPTPTTPSSSTHHSRHVVRHHQHAALRVRQLPEGLHLPERGPELQLHQEVRIGPWGTWPPIPPPIATSCVNEPTRHHHNVGRMSEVSLSVSYFGTSATIRQSNPPPHRLHHYAHLANTKRPRFPASIISSGINWRCADRTKAHGNPCPKKIVYEQTVLWVDLRNSKP